jgi:hypothetical protein
LSQELRTARLPRPHVLVGYQWSHTGLRPGRKTSHNRYIRSFVSHPPRIRTCPLRHTALHIMRSLRGGTLSESAVRLAPSIAIRCGFVSTVLGFDAPAMCPSNGVMTWRPLLSTGSLGMVPPLQRYYGTLRLPVVLLDPFDFFTSRYHRFRPWFAPLGRGRPTGGQGVVGSGLPIRIDDRNVGVSQVPWKPFRECKITHAARRLPAWATRGPHLTPN